MDRELIGWPIFLMHDGKIRLRMITRNNERIEVDMDQEQLRLLIDQASAFSEALE